MRTEREILDLILDYAKKDKRVRAVGLEGSRTNPNVPKDIFQDYDISYFVTDMKSFINDNNWIDVFGEKIIMQKPEEMTLYPPELGNWFSYLMLFTDGNRIDLMLIPLEEKELYYKDNKLATILLDKDDLFPALPSPSDEDYHVKCPSYEFYKDCCNEFWWVSTYVAKGLWRKEILYAIDHINLYVRPALLRMLAWKAGIETSFSKSVGKHNKYLTGYLPNNIMDLLLFTYKNNNEKNCWQSLFTMVYLFRITAQYVGRILNYSYNMEEDRKVTTYIDHVFQNKIK